MNAKRNCCCERRQTWGKKIILIQCPTCPVHGIYRDRRVSVVVPTKIKRAVSQ